MKWEDEKIPVEQLNGAPQSIFAVHGDLDGEQQKEFQEREQYIGLVISNEEFLLPISAVREIVMLVPITFVPNGPDCIDGVINLRGNILPAVNTRKLMGFSRGEPSPQTRIIIAKAEGITFGLIVDGITYVVPLLPSDVENQTLPGKGGGAEFIGGISKQGQKVVGILDLARILKHIAGNLDEEGENDGVVHDAATA